MADYFTYFSVTVPLPDESAQTYALNLAQTGRDFVNGEKLPADFPEMLRPAADDWNFETESDDQGEKFGIWLHSDCGAIDAVCLFIQHLLQKFNPDGRIGFEWSNDCSKPRLDAYGGGAAIVTAKNIQSMTTIEWLRKNGISDD